ncbi:hypothetical protein [Commensalibacter nepenthis]|uniref:Uncharacterized protein n=1 Tax=Commensalibacter nepenthis TaxID=3043872 RepID=A0ABT6QA72_9PROT|nr:hypothetical protein [Commensalibacter sp. TBRC 10068]MDI2113803.1 hypothetical protein [Commensalibacter sp. TBRC 10068]
MRKFLLALPILVFPLIAQAEDKPTHASEAMIQATEKRFFPKYCAEGVKGLAADVYDCYLHTKDTDPKKEECMIGDFMTVAISTRANERAVALGETPKYNIPFFIAPKMRERVDNFITQNQKFKDYNQEEYINYLSQTLNTMIDDFQRLYKKTRGNCSAFFKP